MTITLCGYRVQIDREDRARIASVNWRVKPGVKGLYFCEVRNFPNSLHRFIMGCEKNDGKIVDHKNLDTLDNRRENLRFVTRSGSNANRRGNAKSRSGLKGIWKHRNKWRACIKVNKKRIYLGLHSTPEKAYAAYCEASARYHGEYGRC